MPNLAQRSQIRIFGKKNNSKVYSQKQVRNKGKKSPFLSLQTGEKQVFLRVPEVRGLSKLDN